MPKRSLKGYAIKKTGRNCCVSHILKHAITGASPFFSIDYSQVLVSCGELAPPEDARAAPLVAGHITFTWTNTIKGGHKAKTSDRAILVAYCPALHQTVYTTTGATRSLGVQVLDVTAFRGHDVHTYMGFVLEDGELVANSVYTGMHKVG